MRMEKGESCDPEREVIYSPTGLGNKRKEVAKKSTAADN